MSIAPLRPAVVLAVIALVATASPGVGQSCLCGTAADELVAARAGLHREWVVQVPFDSGAWRLMQVVAGDSLVGAQGGDGTIAAIVAAPTAGGPRPGTVAWSAQVGSRPAPVERAGIGGSSVAVARGDTLTLLDIRSGQVLWERPLRSVASAPPVVSNGWVYAPLDGGGIARFPENPWAKPQPAAEDATDERDDEAANRDEPLGGPRPGESLEPIEIGSDGEIEFPPLVYDGGIVWCTADGRIIALVRKRETFKRLEFDLGGPASGPPVIHAGDIFVATRSGDVARLTQSPQGLTANAGELSDKDGKAIPFTGWHTIVDAVPEGGPVVGSNTLVLSLGPSGMAAFATATGDLLWQVPASGRPLAIVGDRVWCLEETGFLVSRDLATGDRRDQLCLGCFTLPIVNTSTERLILASPGGLVVSLGPRRTVAAEPPVPQPPPPTEDAAAELERPVTP
jgi:outer membrane protein assembly factor BamB